MIESMFAGKVLCKSISLKYCNSMAHNDFLKNISIKHII